MSDEIYKDDSATFNSGVEYTKSLIELERSIAESMFKKNYEDASELIDLLWMELCEWIDEIKDKDKKNTEKEKQDEIRKKQREAASRISYAIKNKLPTINTEDIEIFKKRIIMLKKVIHKVDLRMPKAESDGSSSILSRKPKMNYGRRSY